MSEFENIQGEAIAKASSIDCAQADFLAGLEEMLELLQERVDIERSLQK